MTTPAAPLTVKRGDSFAMAVTLYSGAAPQDLTGWTITSQVRTAADAVVADLTIGSRDDTAGLFVASALVTTSWPVGTHDWDIQYQDAAGTIRSTQTIALQVLRDITRAA